MWKQWVISHVPIFHITQPLDQPWSVLMVYFFMATFSGDSSNIPKSWDSDTNPWKRCQWNHFSSPPGATFRLVAPSHGAWHGSLTSTLGLDSLDPLAGRSRFKSLSDSSHMTGASPRSCELCSPKGYGWTGWLWGGLDVKPQLSSDGFWWFSMFFDGFWWFLIAMFIMFGIHTMNIFKKKNTNK